MQIGARYTPSRQAQSIVPGVYPQVQKDLETFPMPVLDVLDGYGLKVAVLDDGQTLKQSPALRLLSDAEYDAEIALAREATFAEMKQGDYSSVTDFAEKTTRVLRKKGLEFHFGVTGRKLAPQDIARRQNVPSDKISEWTRRFEQLNEGMPQGVFLVPHTYHKGGAIPEDRLRNAGETTASYVEGSLGLHRSEDRLVLLHKKFTPENAVEVGNYRLSIHEVGHALDHVLDRMVGIPGFGTLHRETVDALFETRTKQAEEKGVEEVFTTTRAADNAREYFAEGVEAYLTAPGDPSGEIFRTENCRDVLQQKDPELYTYLDKIMTTEFSAKVAPKAPERPLLPDFIPDPDTEVYVF